MDFDFQLEHLDTTTSDNASMNTQMSHQDSVILNDLTGQIEDLQNKLKLSYRKLFLFETENQKLLKEKNFFFYEKNNIEEQLKIITEKMENLSKYSSEIEEELEQNTEKMQAFEDLTKTQAIDLRRLTKFHAKIQNVIKPYIQNIKNDLETQRLENTKLNKVNNQYLELCDGLNTKIQELEETITVLTKQHEFEKKNLIVSYEEQIHSLSKEILDFQQNIATAESEVLRLKKANETKNFLENELVRFKRTHSEDQNMLQELKLKLVQADNQNNALSYDVTELQKQKNIADSDIDTLKRMLESTRQQLSQKIEDNEKLELRLKMLERLNTNLSTGI